MTPLATHTLALGPAWLDPSVILDWLGPWALVGVAGIIFAECGLLLGFFLPGDSLLFTAGLFVASGQIDIPLWLMCVVLAVSAFVGNAVGYGIGYRAGPAIFDKPKSKLFNPKHVAKTHEFFEKYGNRAIVLGRFVPIVRTFITVSAGVARMDPRRYLTYSLIGGIAWAAGVTVLGYFLGQFTFVREHIDLILVLVVAVSLLPIVIEVLRSRRKGRGEPAPATGQQPAGQASAEQDPANLTAPISMPRDDAPQGTGWDTRREGSGSPDATATSWITPVSPDDVTPDGAEPGRPRDARPAPGGGPAQQPGGAQDHRSQDLRGPNHRARDGAATGGPVPNRPTPHRHAPRPPAPEGEPSNRPVQGGPVQGRSGQQGTGAPGFTDQPTTGLPTHPPAPVESRSSGRPVMGYPAPARPSTGQADGQGR